MITLQVEPYAKSQSPGKGRGTGLHEWDQAYLAFAHWFIEQHNTIWLDRRTKFGHDLPHYEPIDISSFHVWMYIRTDGEKHNATDLVNYLHRLRHLAMTLRDDPDLIMSAADQYLFDAYDYRE